MHLKLRWARFFTLVGWHWTLAAKHAGYDFNLTIPCGKSDCNGSHQLDVRISKNSYGELIAEHDRLFAVEDMYRSPHPALFGHGPDQTHWQMVHGDGGGYYHITTWLGNADELWERAHRD